MFRFLQKRQACTRLRQLHNEGLHSQRQQTALLLVFAAVSQSKVTPPSRLDLWTKQKHFCRREHSATPAAATPSKEFHTRVRSTARAWQFHFVVVLIDVRPCVHPVDEGPRPWVERGT